MADFGFLSPLGLEQVNAIAQQVVAEINEGDWYNASILRQGIYEVLEASSGNVNVYGA